MIQKKDHHDLLYRFEKVDNSKELLKELHRVDNQSYGQGSNFYRQENYGEAAKEYDYIGSAYEIGADVIRSNEKNLLTYKT